MIGLRERLRLVEWVEISRVTVLVEETPCGWAELRPNEAAVLREARGKLVEEAALEAIGTSDARAVRLVFCAAGYLRKVTRCGFRA